MSVDRSTLKSIVMLAGLAFVVATGAACFGLFSGGDEPGAAETPCEQLSGQAKIDCEKRKQQ
jgi:hypothetical protein